MTTVTTGARIDAARAEGRAALVGYLPLGFPDLDTSVAAARAMVEAGVDVVELGLPYTDPVLDGPVIQHAAERALAAGVRTRDVFATAAAIPGRIGRPIPAAAATSA